MWDTHMIWLVFLYSFISLHSPESVLDCSRSFVLDASPYWMLVSCFFPQMPLSTAVLSISVGHALKYPSAAPPTSPLPLALYLVNSYSFCWLQLRHYYLRNPCASPQDSAWWPLSSYSTLSCRPCFTSPKSRLHENMNYVCHIYNWISSS